MCGNIRLLVAPYVVRCGSAGSGVLGIAAQKDTQGCTHLVPFASAGHVKVLVRRRLLQSKETHGEARREHGNASSPPGAVDRPTPGLMKLAPLGRFAAQLPVLLRSAGAQQVRYIPADLHLSLLPPSSTKGPPRRRHRRRRRATPWVSTIVEVAALKICLLLIYDSRRHEALGVAVDDGCWRQRNPVPHPRAVRACLRPPLAAVLMCVRVWQASASQQTSGDPSLPPPCRCKPRCPPAARVTAMLRSHRTRSPLAVPAHFKGLDTPAPRSPASPGTRTPPAWHGSHRGVRAWRVHQLRHSVPTTPCRSQAEQASSLMYH